MPDIKENLNAIEKKIKDLKTAASEASKEVRSIGQEMRIDTSNVDLVKAKYEALGRQLETNQQIYKEYEKQIELLNNELARTPESETEKRKELAKQIEEVGRKAEKTASQINNLTKATSELAKKQEIAKAEGENLRVKFEGIEKAAQKVSRATLIVVAALGALVKASLDSATELYSLAKSYDTNAESIQKYNNILYVATGQQNLYNNALSVMIKGMAQIAAGRGVAYQQALQNIGLSYQQLSTMTTTEQYEAIFAALQNVTDETERAAAAQTLLGDSGLLIANVAGLSADEYARVTEEAGKFGVKSDELVESLFELNREFETAKSQLGVAFAELTVALTPALTAIAEILTNVVAPALKVIGNVLTAIGKPGQTILLILTTSLILLPKLVSIIKIVTLGIKSFTLGTKAATVAVNGFSAAMSKWALILTAIAALVMLITSLFGGLSDAANDTTKDINEAIDGAETVLEGTGEKIANNTETYTTSSTEKSVTIKAEIYGHGDTAVSDDAAQQVAILTADEIQKTFGDLL